MKDLISAIESGQFSNTQQVAQNILSKIWELREKTEDILKFMELLKKFHHDQMAAMKAEWERASGSVLDCEIEDMLNPEVHERLMILKTLLTCIEHMANAQKAANCLNLSEKGPIELSKWLHGQRVNAAQQGRPWIALEQWISNKLDEKEKWRGNEFLDALPEKSDNLAIYRKDKMIHCSTGSREPITERTFRDHVRRIRKEKKYR